MYKTCYSICLLLLSMQQISANNNTLNIQILYESLCPDSLNFITQQLHPAWKELSAYINLKLVPFGKSASMNNGAEFICQHGPRECKGNRIQSCAFSVISNQNIQVDYVNCFMKLFYTSRHNSREFGKSCADSLNVPFNDIMECYNTPQGTKLQLIAENFTGEYSPAFIPTILFNNRFNQQLQDDSMIDFRQVVCRLITPTHPEACKQQHVLRL